MHSRPEAVTGEGQVRLDPVGPGELGILVRPPDEAFDRFYRQIRRDFAGRMAPHAVGHDEQFQRRIADERVFVGLSNRSAVTQAMSFDHVCSLARTEAEV